MIHIDARSLIAGNSIGYAHGFQCILSDGFHGFFHFLSRIPNHAVIHLSPGNHLFHQRTHIHISNLFSVFIFCLERIDIGLHQGFNFFNRHIGNLICKRCSLWILLHRVCHSFAKISFTHMPQLISQYDRGHQFFISLIQCFPVVCIQDISIAVLVIKRIPKLCFIFVHEDLRLPEFLRGDFLRHNMFCTAVLDSHIDDIRSILRQRQIAVSLH